MASVDSDDEPEPKIIQEKISFRAKLGAVFKLFRFMKPFDYFLMLIGLVTAIIHGVALPLGMHFFGLLTNSFLNHFISKFLATGVVEFDPKPFLENPDFDIVDRRIIEAGFVDFSIVTKGVVNCSDDFILLPPDLSFPGIMQDLFTTRLDCLTDDPFIDMMNEYLLAFLGIGFVVMIVGPIQMLTFQVSSDRQAKSIKTNFFHAVLNQDATWFDGKSSGELSSRLSNDIEKIQEGIGINLAIVVQWGTTFFAGFVIGFLREWRLTLVLLGITPIIAVTIGVSSVIVLMLTSKEQQHHAAASAAVEEVLTSIKTVVAYGGEQVELDRYTEKLHKAKESANKRGIVSSLSVGIIFFLIFTTYGIGFWFSGYLLQERLLLVGDVFTVFFAVMIGIFSIGQAVPNIDKLLTAAGSSIAVYHIIDEGKKSTSATTEAGSTPEKLRGVIEFSNVNFAYPSRPDTKVLKDFSFKVEEGKTVALVGPSGCGKSTVIELLLRFYDVTQGQVLLGGHNIRSLNVKWLRSQFGFVGQEPVLFDTSVAENIGMGKEGATYEEVVSAAKDANAHEFIYKNWPDGYKTSVGKQGTHMSGGQKQRIAIARALIRDPEILLLDDATSALDSESELMVQKTLDQARAGRTTILVSHRMSTIMSADIIAFMEDGAITGVGTHEELISSNETYANLVTTEYIPEERRISVLPPDIDDQQITINTDKQRKKSKEELEMEDFTSDGYLIKLEGGKKETIDVSWTRIWKMNSPELWLIVIGLTAAIVQAFIYPGFAFLFGKIIQSFILPSSLVLERTHKWAAAFIALGFVAGIANFVESASFFVSGGRLTRRLQVAVFKNILSQEMSWFDKKENSVSVLTSRLSNSVPKVQEATGLEFGALIQTTLSLLVAIIASLILNLPLALVIIGFVPFVIVPGFVQLYVIKRFTRIYKKKNDIAEKIAMDTINNHHTVRALCMEKTFVDAYKRRLDDAYKNSPKRGIVYGLIYGFGRGVIFWGYGAIFRFGAYQSAQPVDSSEFKGFDTIYIIFMALVFGSLALGQASGFATSYSVAKQAGMKVFSLLDRKSNIDSYSEDGKKLDKCTGEISVKNVYFTYPNRPGIGVAHDMSFSALANKTTALVGPSGYGKSTIMSLILRFYDPITGKITIDGKDLRKVNVSWLRSQIGIVFQEPVLFDRTIADNIKYGANFRDVTREEIIQAAKDAKIHDFIVNQLPMGYETIAGEKGTLLSRGQKQRIAIARAFLRNPRLLLLDEATSALDPDSEREVQKILDDALKDQTSIVIAHRLSTIRNADKIAVVSEGKISEEGTHSQLMERDDGIYRKMYEYQSAHKI